MRPTSKQTALTSLIALCIAAVPVACDDKKEDSKDKPKTEDKKSEDDKKKDGDDGAKANADGGKDDGKADGGKDDGKADGGKDDGKATGDPEKDAEIAALKAELEAAKEAAEAAKEIDAEAAKALDPELTPEDEVAHEEKLKEGEKGPVSVASISFGDKQSYGDRGTMFEISAEVTVNEAKEGGVYAKAACVIGEEVFVNVGTISNKYGDLGKMKVEETKRLSTLLFTSGLAEKPTRCQLAIDYGAANFSTRIGDFCWDGKKVTDGDCAEPVKANKKGEGKVVPFDFKVKPHKAMGKTAADATALTVSYGARFNEHIEDAPHLHTKTACKVGDKTWVEVAPNFPHVKPFSLENGEAVMVHHNQFYMNALPAKPEACNLQVFLDGGYGKPDIQLGEVCAKAGGVTDGKCAFRTDPANPPAPMAAESITIDELTLTWGKDWRDESKLVLQAKLAATVAKSISNRVQLTADVSCSAKDDRQHHIGPDLEFIKEGESIGIQFSAFRDTPLEKADGRCELTFGTKDFMANSNVEITKFCVKGAKITAGKCKGKGKGKAPDAGTPIVFAAKK